MDYEECKKIIIFECIAGEGFLVKLHGHEFSKAQFDELFKALLFYRDFTRNADLIEKEMVYSLYFLDNELTGILKYFSKDDFFLELQTSQMKCSELIIDIITPKKMRGTLPGYFI